VRIREGKLEGESEWIGGQNSWFGRETVTESDCLGGKFESTAE